MCGLIDSLVGCSGLLWVVSWIEAMGYALWSWVAGC